MVITAPGPAGHPVSPLCTLFSSALSLPSSVVLEGFFPGLGNADAPGGRRGSLVSLTENHEEEPEGHYI